MLHCCVVVVVVGAGAGTAAASYIAGGKGQCGECVNLTVQLTAQEQQLDALVAASEQ